jgi:hypothetical protein
MRLAGIALGCLVSFFSTGCCMCAAPYDYCAPTYTGQRGEDCRPHARVNSAFSGCGPAGYEPTMADDEGSFEMEDGGELPAAARPAPRPMPGTYSALRNPK